MGNYKIHDWEKARKKEGVQFDAFFLARNDKGQDVVTSACGRVEISLTASYKGQTETKKIIRKVKWDAAGKCTVGTKNNRYSAYDIILENND
ncbi:MAG: hypothetical protein RR383_09360 [Muribaculaceae bacterium]